MRPLGIAALEDKIVQQATRTILECIYEEDFLGDQPAVGARLWISSSTQSTSSPGCIVCRDHEAEGKLDHRCGHSGFL